MIDDYAEGKDTGLIDLVLIGEINEEKLRDVVRKTENYLDRKIRTLVMNQDEFDSNRGLLEHRPVLVLWSNNIAGQE